MPADLTNHWVGYLSLCIFATAILLVTIEEFTKLRKSKPMLLAAGMIWGLIGWSAQQSGGIAAAQAGIRQGLLQYTELMLLMLVVMTYINALSERRVFAAMGAWMGHRRYSYRQLFWITGLGAFFLSPFLDNLSTALLMGAAVITVGGENRRFVSLGCINVVIAANAGGAFSPFGDITTLMVWQQQIRSTTGAVDFWSFFALFIPSAINYLIPALLMHLNLPRGCMDTPRKKIRLRRGARRIIALFLLTIASAVLFQSLLKLPAVIGMLTGLSYLQFFGYYLKKTHGRYTYNHADEDSLAVPAIIEGRQPFDIFLTLARAEWDTLLFLCGVILAVGGLGYLGYIGLASELMYTQWGATAANISVGIASSILENIPAMSAVLLIEPGMSLGQWLLVTLTAGVGGSLLSIGSAAGVALMGQSGGAYTFFSHLRWSPAILLGYAASILFHLWWNQALF